MVPAVSIALALSACSSVGELSGAVAGVATGAVTANPIIGYGVAIGVSAAADATSKYVSRNWQRAEQDSIAAVIGQAQEGTEQRWQIRHPIPYGNEQGSLRVLRTISSPLAQCKEALFSVEDYSRDGQSPAPHWFLTTACQQQGQWKWASAEPAVARWGNLQ
jgi:hypothetical protein